MEEEDPRPPLAVSLPMPSFPMEDPQSGASTPGADAALVNMGRTIFASTVDETSGVVMGNAFARKNMSITGSISVKEFNMNAFSNTTNYRPSWNKGYQDNYYDCLRRLGSTTSQEDFTMDLKNEEQWIDGTCEWFFDLDQCQSWHSGKDSSLLMFLGNTGIGKTMMSHFLIDKLLDVESQQDHHKAVAHFFCDYHTQRNTTTAVLAGLLVQLLQQRKENFKHISHLYGQYRDSLPDNLNNLWTVFVRLLKSLDGDVYLIIDGMDKCDETSRKELFTLFIKSVRIKKRDLTIKILLTSRSESDFPKILDGRILKVEQKNISEHLSASVSRFIEVRIKNLPVFSNMEPKIHRIISKQAGDTYLWASFVFQDLDKALTNEEVVMKLQNLPRDLHDVYDRMLREIDSANAEEAAFVLRMAALARRPLRPKELGLLYTLRPGKWSSSGIQALEQVKPDENLHKACKSLVYLDSSLAIRFVHQSAKEYLLDRRLSINYSSDTFFTRKLPVLNNSRIYNFIASVIAKMLGTLGLIRGISRYHVVPDETHLLLLRICWTCMSAREFQHGKRIIQRKEDGELSPNPDLHRFLELRPEVSYIVNEWQEHALAAGPALSTCRAWLSDNLHKLPTLRDLWLHRVVLAGDMNTARLLLDNHADVNTRWGEHGSILHEPSCTGNEEMIQLLLEHGADVDAKGRLFDNALEAASCHGHAKVVKLLLEHQATVNAQDEDSCSALQIAAASGNTEIVRTLLLHGANANSSGCKHPRPLLGAATHGDLELIQLLLDHGADVNAQGQGHAYALQAASCAGHFDVVKLLVSRGADVNARGGEHGKASEAAWDANHDEIARWLMDQSTQSEAETVRKKDQGDNPLYLAALSGRLDEVQTLLEHHDVNIRGGTYGSPLQAAAYDGHKKVVQLLIDNGADVNAQGGEQGSPLQAAAYDGHESVVRLLINNGADVNAQAGSQGNALHIASKHGHVGTMRVLLSHGAKTDIHDEPYGTILHAVLFAGHSDTEVVRLLLEYGAPINAYNIDFGTPLVLAASQGNIAIAQLLVDNGAKVNAKGGRMGSALEAAAASGNISMVEFLLGHGADVNAEGSKYGSALQAAAIKGKKHVVQLLLDHDAEVNAEGGQYGFALQAAAITGKKSVVQLLLNHGAEVNAKGGQYGFALQAAAIEGNEDVVKLLLDNDADVNAKGGEFDSALQAAAYRGSKSIVEYLLDCGADINTKGGRYGFALQAAAYGGSKAVVELLLDRDAYINAKGGPYGTALNAARHGKHEAVVQLLQQLGAYDAKSSKGMLTGQVGMENVTSPTLSSSGKSEMLARQAP
ncbi:uncharacterized protein LTHEOB_4684 [Lasiodiplodia theobromae]|uniref:uncharacterized protein n=1 Tax=Lasiodiplodia theobromae TaxID=45133 RepID=UPI0015C38D26|nr:uncharacterized protein LTHEOB_4684 [Lasiodiplodia theobromae]KAF4546032.1 hypothetical protein LTHEOB_4684 [Lasiodiplodia theobromae]